MLLTLAAFGTAATWVASCTLVGDGFQDYDGVHGISVLFPYSNGTWGFAASDATGTCELSLLFNRRIDDSKAVSEHYGEFAGFFAHRWAITFPASGRCLVQSFGAPLWMLFVFFAAYPAVAFVRGPWRRYYRKKRGRCVRCAYDLTGNVSGRCPECGYTCAETAGKRRSVGECNENVG